MDASTLRRDARTVLRAVPLAAWRLRDDRSRPFPRYPFVAVIVGSVCVAALVSADLAELTAGGRQAPGALFLAVLQVGPLVAITWRPLAAWRVAVVGMLVETVAAHDATGFPWSPVGVLTYLALLFALCLAYERAAAIGAAAVSVLGLVLPAVAADRLSTGLGAWSVVVVVGLAALGENMRGRRVTQRRLVEQEDVARHGQARQAVLEERSRIARELHDVVAHHMSMIAIQAEAAPYKIPDLPPEARRTLEVIRTASTTALTEMRRVVGLLRGEADEAERMPQPGLDQVGALVEQARDAGMAVDLSVHTEPGEVPGAVELSAYRIVQEALSNAGRHAPGARVRVEVDRRPAEIRVRVVNDAPPGGATGAGAAQVGGTHGLVGMRERVVLYGGRFDAGPTDGGGFEVVAVLPVEVGT